MEDRWVGRWRTGGDEMEDEMEDRWVMRWRTGG